MIRILIADDHSLVRMGLQALLGEEADIEVIGQARNGTEALKLYEELRPDVLLMDLRMPVLDGQDATRMLLAQHPDAKIVVLSSFSQSEDVRQALQSGARGYVRKDVDDNTLLDTIRRVHRGAVVVSQDLRDATLPEKAQVLSVRETEMLRQMASGKSNREISEHLSLGEGTVKTYITRLFVKLGARDRTEAVTLALRSGILRVDEIPGEE